MPYNPAFPVEHTEILAEEFRDQFHGLKALIDAIAAIIAAQIDGVSTLPAGASATVAVAVTGDTLHFTFAIPRGNDGAQGIQGIPGAPGAPGADGTNGQDGEVSNAALDAAIAGTSNNTNAVATLGITVSDPPTQAEMQAIANKQDELILAARRA